MMHGKRSDWTRQAVTMTSAAAAVLMLSGSAWGQSTEPPKRVGNTTVGPIKDLSGWPPRTPLPEIKDAEVAAASAALVGCFESAGQAGASESESVPALSLGTARVDVAGLDNAVVFELARADTPWKPFRQGIMHIYKAAGGLRLRMFDFVGQPSFGEAIAGLWLTPDLFPEVSLSQLTPNVDMALSKEGAKFSGKTAARVPSRWAWEVESAISFGGDEVTFADRGFDATGKQVLGVGEGKPLVFKKGASTAKVQRLEGGLAVIDLVAGDATPAAADGGGQIAVHYTGWLHSDGWKFASSLDLPWNGSGVEPQVFKLPNRMLSGWSMGIPGITKGGVRRLVMPSGLAFGNVGSPQWKVPPNTGVVFEVRCVYVEKAPEAPAADAAAPAPTPAPVEPSK